ncbi:T9SS type A sorting domain-containing protein [Seonamhaeicola sp.]|uniref:T9SS type A sorting domain-containing protein n=1 Tax=Seonamhaeicola sp. TaxID=1912245 RepID=UPI00260A2781|nr:T9SS type A sorting domain-containing protein [Seonamhaeicola sp.]
MKLSYYFLLLLFTCHLSFSQQKSDTINPLINERSNTVFKCHPNPVESELFILGTHKIKTIEFIDILGKRAALYRFNRSIVKIDVSHLKSGIYLVQAIDEYNKVETKKLIVK